MTIFLALTYAGSPHAMKHVYTKRVARISLYYAMIMSHYPRFIISVVRTKWENRRKINQQ